MSVVFNATQSPFVANESFAVVIMELNYYSASTPGNLQANDYGLIIYGNFAYATAKGSSNTTAKCAKIRAINSTAI